MCEACAAEYHDPADRRFHAQPVACPACGPRLRLIDREGRDVPGDPVERAGALLRDGIVLAVKGLGGYHLAVDARDEPAAAALRSRKHRADKPFAVMAAGAAEARELCEVGPVAEALLTSRRRPVVLLGARTEPVGGPLAPSVAPGTRQLGLMLPYTPLHHLLLAAVAGPIVLSSGNVSDEPIAYSDDDAFARLSDIAEFFLVHDRPIHLRADDSVARIVPSWPPPGGPGPRLARGEKEQVIRRARGYAPEPLALAFTPPRPVLACGAQLKSTFCLTRGHYAFVSPHIGDLENYETLRAFSAGVEHYERMFGVTPAVLAHDLHPDYLSTAYATRRAEEAAEGSAGRGPALVGVQHHHAHIAACLADNRHPGPVLGVAFDGLGYGVDGTLWGGEFLLADLTGFTRLACLDQVPLPGGEAAVRAPWRMAASFLAAADLGGAVVDWLPVRRRNAARWEQVTALARRGVAAPPTSSAGRLFDAVAALLDVRDTVSYEGQAAIELEQLADPAEHGAYPEVAILTPDAGESSGDPWRVRGVDLVAAVVDDLRAGSARATVAARFHTTLARSVVAVCRRLADETGVRTVALSGGVFANQRLLGEAGDGLAAAGLAVLTHGRVPTNDGGISLGQAAVAAASGPRAPV
jgi:hydrogenase maturation protein HypF